MDTPRAMGPRATEGRGENGPTVRAHHYRGPHMTVTLRGYLVIIAAALAVVGFAGWIEGL